MGTLTDALTDPAACVTEGDHFRAWWQFWGELDQVGDECGTSRILGFENETDPTNVSAELANDGATFGFVSAGGAVLEDDAGCQKLTAGMWFAVPVGCVLRLDERSRVVATQRIGFRGVRAFGGPVEEKGRLRYIDGCSDTLLACPPVLGDPCLNLLHFPHSIAQTEHYHPSVRSGTVARGVGWCETPAGFSPLVPGMAFSIPARGLHRFLTEHDVMDVIAYHPDTDWGPTDDDHPMINRTWVGGAKVDNSAERHASAEVEGRWLQAVEV